MDDSELDMREIVPRVGRTAETDKLITPMRVRRVGRVLEVLLKLSDEAVLMVVF